MDYRSVETYSSQILGGVSFTIRRMSFGRRLRLLSALRDVATRLEVATAGHSADDRLEASLCQAEMQSLYIEWGLVAIDGLTIDGSAPTSAALIESGPEALCREIADAVQREAFLAPDERKN